MNDVGGYMWLILGIFCGGLVSASMAIFGVAPIDQIATKPAPVALKPPAVAGAEAPPAKHATLGASTDAQLRGLNSYEQRLGRGFDRMMLFRDMPTSTADAKSEATELVSVLKEYAKHGIEPLVIFEPQGLDLARINASAFNTYFDTLKAKGVTDAEMGTWVPFPEPNIPEWEDGDTSASRFVGNATVVAQALKSRFPQAKVALLLDSSTYPSGDTDWEHGSFESSLLVPYVSGFPKGLIDQVGLQGFAWAPMAGDEGSTAYDPAVFLSAQSAITMAKQLGIKDVFFNSGSFASMYDWLPGKRISVSVAQRDAILKGILNQAQQTQQAGLQTSVVLFAEDKRQTEADWSYNQDAANWSVLQNFVNDIGKKSIKLAIFDAAGQ